MYLWHVNVSLYKPLMYTWLCELVTLPSFHCGTQVLVGLFFLFLF
jgi:hypothetical protein